MKKMQQDDSLFSMKPEKSLDTKVQKYGKKSKKSKKSTTKSATSKPPQSKSLSSSSSAVDVRLAKYTVWVAPVDLLRSATNNTQDTSEALRVVFENGEKTKLFEEILKLQISAYASHIFPHSLRSEVRKAAQSKNIWTMDTDLAAHGDEWKYVSVSATKKNVTVCDATVSNTPTNRDINDKHRRKHLIYISNCESNGVAVVALKKQLNGAPVTLEMFDKILQGQIEIRNSIALILDHLNIKTVKFEKGAMDIDYDNECGNKLVDLCSRSGSPSMSPALRDIPPLPHIMEEFLPNSLKDEFFNGWVIANMFGDGNCLHRFFAVVVAMAGYQKLYHSQFRQLFYDTIKLLSLKPELTQNDVLISNIISAKADLDIILKDKSWVNDDYMDSFLLLFTKMFHINMVPYTRGFIRRDLLSAIGYDPEFGTIFACTSGSHWMVAMKEDLHKLVCPQYPVLMEIGQYCDYYFDQSECCYCFKKISKKNKTFFVCDNKCAYASAIHEKCLKKAIIGIKFNEIGNEDKLLCNNCWSSEHDGMPTRRWRMLTVPTQADEDGDDTMQN